MSQNKCSKCGQLTDEYIPNTCWCRECKNETTRELYKKNKVRYKAAQERGPDNYKFGNIKCF